MKVFRVYVLVTPMKRSPCFRKYSAAGTDTKYESAQTILSVLAHGITSCFSNFLPLWILSWSSFCYSSFFADLITMSFIIIPARTTCSIMDLRPILRLPVHFHIHRQTQIYPMNTLSVPSRYGIISTYEIRRREELCTIVIKMSNEVFIEFPPMILMARTVILHIWLMDPSKMPPHHIKTLHIHTGLA